MDLTKEKIKFKMTDEKPCQVTLSVQIPPEVITARESQVSTEFQKFARLPGFRAGKAPIDLVKQSYQEKIKSETLEQVLRDAIPEILKEKSISPITSPVIKQLQFDPRNAVSFNLIIERSPEFKVKSYTKISAEKKIKKIMPQDVEKELDQLRERNAQLVPSKAEKAEKNHFAVIDYEASVDGKPIPDLKASNQMINLSAPQSIEGIAEGVLGLAKDESKSVTVQFPKEYPQKEIAGKPVNFNVTLRDLKEKVLPALDDELAKDFGLSTLQELKTKIDESLQNAAKKNSEAELEKQILDHLIKENPIPLPESLVQAQLEHLVEQLLSQVRVPPEKAEESKSMLREKYKAQAERQVRLSYLLGGISRQENLKASVEELKQEMEKAAQTNPAKAEAVKEYFDRHQSSILNQMTEEKVMKFLIEHGKIKEVQE